MSFNFKRTIAAAATIFCTVSMCGCMDSGYIGTVDGIQNKAQIDTIMNGKIGYMLNKAKIGTINSGEVNELCDSARIDTINDGDVNHMMGNSMIYQQIGGEVKNRTGQALLIYTQKQERNLESQIEMNIEDVIIKKPSKRVGRKKIFDDL